jgi:hypothetical protein
MSDLPDGENPYWHSEGQTHSVDLAAVRRICFEVFNIFTASASLVEGLEFVDEGEEPEYPSLLSLHHEMAEPRAMEQLLRLAMLVRTYDDIMNESDDADGYAKHAKETAGEDYIGTLDTGRFNLREACNKIIHAREVRPIYDDVEYQSADGKKTKAWHLRGEIEFAGAFNKKEWNAVLYVPHFLEIALDRVSFGWGKPQTGSKTEIA